MQPQGVSQRARTATLRGMPAGNDESSTIAWRLGALERTLDRKAAVEDLRRVEAELATKADSKEVSRLADEFKSLRLTLQWFMGIVAAGAIAFAVLVVQLLP